MNVLELYSGIGGMHLALQESGVPYTVKASIEINPVANAVYVHVFPDTPNLNRNIENLTAEFISSLNVDTILMSPPCQPFTRNGLRCDVDDNRTNSFQHLLKLLPHLNVTKILIENVKGFESSRMQCLLTNVLNEAGFTFQEFLLNSNQFGVPNSRTRYYCLAKRSPEYFKFDTGPLMTNLPEEYTSFICDTPKISSIIEENVDLKQYLIPEAIVQKRAAVLDICFPHSQRSCCFTKSYGRYLDGTGSVYAENSPEIYNRKEIIDSNNVKQLKLRFFTPREVARLMNFPDAFNFPQNLSNKQKYKLLGNSINIKVVSELIKVLAD